MREEPLFRKCCHCIPLKSCLLAWVTFKIIADISVSLFLMFLILILDSYNGHGYFFKQFDLIHAFIIITVLLVTDSAFMIVLSAGLCQNNIKIVKVFFYYSITMFTMIALILMLLYIFVIVDAGDDLKIIFPVCSIIYLCLDIGIALTAKSEIIKLRNKEQYEFVKMPALRTESQKTQEVSVENENFGYA